MDEFTSDKARFKKSRTDFFNILLDRPENEGAGFCRK